jgi:hypothetical protein
MDNKVQFYTPIENVSAYRSIVPGKVTVKRAWILSLGIFSALFYFLASGSNGGEKKTFIAEAGSTAPRRAISLALCETSSAGNNSSISRAAGFDREQPVSYF